MSANVFNAITSLTTVTASCDKYKESLRLAIRILEDEVDSLGNYDSVGNLLSTAESAKKLQLASIAEFMTESTEVFDFVISAAMSTESLTFRSLCLKTLHRVYLVEIPIKYIEQNFQPTLSLRIQHYLSQSAGTKVTLYFVLNSILDIVKELDSPASMQVTTNPVAHHPV